MNSLQDKIKSAYKTIFGYTPLSERIKDIQNQFFEIIKYNDMNHLRTKTGDMLSSLIQLCNENNWDIDELVGENIDRVTSLKLQYQTLGRRTNICILGGAYNMITIGHIQTAKFILNCSKKFDEVWLMPTYKHMYGKQMVSPEHRLEMCRLAALVDNRIKVFDYEIRNQLSGETYFTCKKLRDDSELYANYNFSMAIGIDNANTFHNWVNYDELERIMKFVIIPRKGYVRDETIDWYLKQPHIFMQGETGIIEISSTQIRHLLTSYYRCNDQEIFNDLKKVLDVNVLNYIIQNNLYL